ncbi:hypothetical protein GCM10027605_18880 [Micromonospora zhanjiangensis]
MLPAAVSIRMLACPVPVKRTTQSPSIAEIVVPSQNATGAPGGPRLDAGLRPSNQARAAAESETAHRRDNRACQTNRRSASGGKDRKWQEASR